jgi:hypothetical protein
MKNLVLAGVAALALCAAFTGTAKASDYYPRQTEAYEYKKVVTYNTVIEYVVRTEKYVKYAKVYDDYSGCYKTVAKVCYRDVKVPVQRVVPVVNYVKVKVCKAYCD